MIRDFHAEETYAKALFVAISAMFDTAVFEARPSGGVTTTIKVGLRLDCESDEAVDVTALVLMFLDEFKDLANKNQRVVWRGAPHWVLEPSAAGDTLYLRARVALHLRDVVEEQK